MIFFFFFFIKQLITLDIQINSWANNVDPDGTFPKGAVW